MGIFSFLQKRKIKEVDSWNGSASNYSTPQAYAAASLINFNPAAGRAREEWTKDLIALPVRQEGDSSDTYIKQAVQAASGGRGITRVKKPSEVSQDDFDRLIKSAANEIVKAYGQWDGIAPDSVYNLAGKTAPKERAVAFNEIFSRVWESVDLADMAEETYTVIIDVYYDEDNGNFFALGMRDGKVYKMNILAREDDIMLGEFEEVEIGPMASKEERSLLVYRDKNGKRRWLSISSVATLNRVGEIDSRQLFDSFITYARMTNKYPILNVYHLGDGSKIGQADFLAREGYVYITSGVFDETPYAQAVADTLEKEPGKWGDSIEYYAFGDDIETFEVEGMRFQARVYTVGINTAISVLLERDAASVLTTHQVKRNNGGVIMNEQLRNALLELFAGDEEQVDSFLSQVNETNGQAMTRISRSATAVVEEETEAEETVEEETVTEEAEAENVEEEVVTGEDTEIQIELGETFVNDLVRSAEFVDALGQLVNERLAKFEQRMAKLENEAEETREWVEDRPKQARKAVVSYRARGNNNNGAAQAEEPKTYAEVAAQTIENIFD